MIKTYFNLRCKIPGYPNDTFALQSDYHKALVNQYIPPNNDDDTLDYDKCHLYDVIGNDNTSYSCNEWVYDDSVFESTFTKEVRRLSVTSNMCSATQLCEEKVNMIYFRVYTNSICKLLLCLLLKLFTPTLNAVLTNNEFVVYIYFCVNINVSKQGVQPKP